MRVLIACEFSGIVREAFKAKGNDAWSCDLLPTEIPGNHLQGDCLSFLDTGWDLLIAHPPCTYLCSSGLHWNTRTPGRQLLTEFALKLVQSLLFAKVPKIALENPVGCISTRIRPPDQLIQPYQFGDSASKRTCLWLKGLPDLTPTTRIPGRMVSCNGKLVERWDNQTDSGQNRLGPSPNRAGLRAKTYPGIAKAMAEQWG